jgi:membrane-associated phospholipid phosphatase
MKDPIYVRRGIKNSPYSFILFVPWKYKWTAGTLVVICALFLYLTSNHYPIFTPDELPLGRIDKQVPFIPETLWIYVSLFFFIPYTFSVNRCVVSLNKHLYSFVFTILISISIFWLFPVTYPRMLYPIPEHTDLLSRKLAELVRAIDPPANCAPSLHVSIAYQIAFGFLEDRRELFPWVFLWATLLVISTLTTKQHYFFDVVTGALLAVFIHLVFHHLVSYRFR